MSKRILHEMLYAILLELKMEKLGNIELYTDDEEIIDILSELPRMEEYDNLNIFEFIERKTEKSDFGTVISFNEKVYSLYKFDKHLIAEEDAGLIMTISSPDFAIEQLNVWKLFKEQGMSLSNKIFTIMSDTLIAQQAVNKFFKRPN